MVLTDDPLHQAVADNAAWCDVVCRAHGVPTRTDADAWVALRRSPPMYPDAVTLRAGTAVGALLSRVDAAAGCSVKDGHADLDLTAEGFRVLFEASWLHREPPSDRSVDDRWTPVGTPAALARWDAAHSGAGVFRPPLLADARIAVLARWEGDAVLAGAVASCTGPVVGISNVFGPGLDPDELWSGALGAVAARFPGRPLVGYEHGADLAAARRAGFAELGPLRVWLRD